MKYFSSFRFDPTDRCLWSGAELVPLTRKAADVLACLVNDAGTTVSHQKLMQTVWPDTHVQPDNIKVLVHELRHALGDQAATPLYVESEPGRGYKFVAAVADAPCPLLDESGHERPPLLPREGVVARIEAAIDRAIRYREPEYLFLEGMPGSGKTTVCREIHRRSAKWPALRTACGRAHRSGAPSLSAVVSLIDRLLLRYPVITRPALERHAPNWLATVGQTHPGTPTDLAAVDVLAFELADALGALGQDDAFLLVLEDLHWSGATAFDLLSHLINETIPSRVVVVATYVPFGSLADRADDPPHTAPRRHHTALRLLPVSDVETRGYLERRFGHACADALGEAVHDATMGHTASVATVADRLATDGLLIHGVSGWSLGVPVRQMRLAIADTMTDAIRTQLEGLRAEDRRMLEAAAAVGWEFTDRALAEATSAGPLDAVGDILDLLALHLPIFERLPPVRGKRAALGATFRFRHRQWFDTLRGHAAVACA